MQITKEKTKGITNHQPTISIVIPVFNASEYIADTLESALSQTYKPLEIICVDDYSTDNSAEIIARYKKVNACIKYVKNPENVGVCITRNKGISIAEGEFILPFDADDLIEKTYCEKAINAFKNDPEISVVFCQAKFFNANKQWAWALPRYNAKRMLFRNLVFSCAFYRKSDWERFSGYNPNMTYGFEDWDFWLNFVENKLKFYQLPEVLFYYRRQVSVNPSISQVVNNKDNKKLMIEQLHKNHPSLYRLFIFKRTLAYLATLLSKIR